MTASRTARTARPRTGAAPRGPAPELVLVAAVAILCGFGLVMLYSASQVLSITRFDHPWHYVGRQAIWLTIGVALALVAARIPLRVWRDQLAWVLMGAAVLSLGWVAAGEISRRLTGSLLPFVIQENDATRWVGTASVRFQPSELAKLALVLWLARDLSDRGRDLGTWRGLRAPLGAAGVVALLVMVGDDLGTTLLLGLVVVAMLWMAGAPRRTIGALFALMAAGAVAAIRFLQGFRANPITAFLNPSEHTSGAGYQLLQSQIGLASGGLFGSGAGYSRAKWGFLPEAHTDFIAAVIGEEFGLLGTLFLVTTIAIFLGAGFAISMRASSLFGRLVAIGITVWIGVQALINIGVTVGLLPTKGITLPFISYGGSSMMLSLMGVGVLVAVARDR